MSRTILRVVSRSDHCNTRQVTILTLSLTSPTLPEPIVFTLSESAEIAKLKNNPVTIKEGVEYSLAAHFNPPVRS